MIDWKVFKNKYFWITVLTISFVAAFYSYYDSKKASAKLENASIVSCNEFRSHIKNSSIIVIVDLKYADTYIDYFDGNSDYNDFRSYSIPEGTKVYIIDSLYSGKLLNIVIVEKSAKGKIYDESWIWHEFIGNNN
jgi:hypothetical protein